MRKTFWACAAVCLGLAASAAATTVQRLSDQALTEQADLIVVGRAADRQTRWVDRDLVTFVTVSVHETLKGEAVASVSVAVPGGIDTQRRIPLAVTYPGAPSFGANEEVVLFLLNGENLGGAYAVAGFSQGKYSVVEDQAGVKLVTRDLSEVTVADREGRVSRGTQTRKRLAELRDDIRRHLAALGGAR